MHREPSPDATPPTPMADAPTSATTPSAVDRAHSPGASIHSVSQPQPDPQPDPQPLHAPLHLPLPPYPHEPDVLPPYEPEADEATNPNDFLASLDAFIAICPDLILPITAIPPAPTWHGTSVPADRVARNATDRTNSSSSSTTTNDVPGAPSLSPNTYRLCSSIVYHFFTAIASRQDDVVRLFITRGLVSPDVPSVTGETPLLAAVRAGDGTTLCALVELGATVDAYGSTHETDVHDPRRRRATDAPTRRTPLQYAAALGRLPLVKLLREDFGADDALVAPDGEIALRLAARGRHRDVVAYLPTRRAGAALRSLGNIIGPLLYRPAEAPEYYRGLWWNLVLYLAVVGLVGVTTAHVAALNARHALTRVRRGKPALVRDRSLEEEEGGEGEGEGEGEGGAWAVDDATDLENEDFVFVY
ncbi:hypothetical protein BN1723_007905 [Verticillium longisporum]|uniref:Uncharacterized protein n=1 Tax=Verticillium longisporum TaxID=100787 RepID=A0A0G4NP28_VERLO|nr:hypothetical protein BN1723_007905 [Verticillium longisporum]